MLKKDALTRRGLVGRAFPGGVAALLAACVPEAGAGLSKPVRIGFQRSGVLLVAKARGGLKAALHALSPGVQWIEFPSGPPLMEALGAGAIDLGAVGETPPIFAQAAGAPILYAAAQPVAGAAAALLVPARSRAAALPDLKGRRIAFTRATSSHLFVIQALRHYGMSLADIRPVYLSPADASGAFASGSIDAWATWDPYYALGQRNQGAKAILTGEALPRTNSFFVAARSFADQHAAVLAALLGALDDQARWAESHHSEVAALIAAATDLPLDVAAATLRRGPLAVRPIDDAVIAEQQAAADIFRQVGVIPNPVDIRAAAWRGWRPA